MILTSIHLKMIAFLKHKIHYACFLNGFGRYKGDAFKRWLEEIITGKEFKPNITFAELKKINWKRVVFFKVQTYQHVGLRRSLVKMKKTRNMPIIEAVRNINVYPILL
ncbi:hypothetical protein RCO48_02430 [Peribacillus frigoritolerans]|nr:hypothetical protein [Peribacillus frigoritolerans]